jgi:hypothetical protein
MKSTQSELEKSLDERKPEVEAPERLRSKRVKMHKKDQDIDVFPFWVY